MSLSSDLMSDVCMSVVCVVDFVRSFDGTGEVTDVSCCCFTFAMFRFGWSMVVCDMSLMSVGMRFGRVVGVTDSVSSAPRSVGDKKGSDVTSVCFTFDIAANAMARPVCDYDTRFVGVVAFCAHWVFESKVRHLVLYVVVLDVLMLSVLLTRCMLRLCWCVLAYVVRVLVLFEVNVLRVLTWPIMLLNLLGAWLSLVCLVVSTCLKLLCVPNGPLLVLRWGGCLRHLGCVPDLLEQHTLCLHRMFSVTPLRTKLFTPLL